MLFQTPFLVANMIAIAGALPHLGPTLTSPFNGSESGWTTRTRHPHTTRVWSNGVGASITLSTTPVPPQPLITVPTAGSDSILTTIPVTVPLHSHGNGTKHPPVPTMSSIE
ncbi:hypothetical protein F4779DRAFT_620460 [Xylariaceae sp. FL0662B]|nr:hypothetical protein F4779DRAFT_620460 [Xylariaceae sp. FL0662B]